MPNQLFISDERMLALIKWAVDTGKANSERQFLESINFTRTNITKVREGRIGFTKEQILNAANLTGANINWIFGLEGNMLRKESKSVIEQLQAAVVAVEAELKRKKSR